MPAAVSDVDLSEFYKLSHPKRKPCPVRPVLDGLNAKERGQFEAACRVDAGIITNQALASWLKRHGPERWLGSWQNALSHRDGKCACND